jgi:triosephosphate isomerase (TIM)
MRRKLVAGNWKMHKTRSEAAAVVEAFVRDLDVRDEVDVVICPPFTTLPRLHDLLKGTTIALGGQDVFWKEEGAFTGRISPAMLADCGAIYCIVGHSETRGRFGKTEVPESTLPFFGETDETVNLKVCALLFHAIAPIVCVGETSREREEGQTDAVIRKQLEGAFEGVEGAEFMQGVVAYEPVWAIGTGQTCEAAEANRVCGTIRAVLSDLLGTEAAESVRVLYGGSVKASNAHELFAQPEIDGGLVGGASLQAEEFQRIVASA